MKKFKRPRFSAKKSIEALVNFQPRMELRVYSSKLGTLRRVESNPQLGEFTEVDGKITIGTKHDVTSSYEIPSRSTKKKKTKTAHS